MKGELEEAWDVFLAAGTDEAKKEAENECARIDKALKAAEKKHQSVDEEIEEIARSDAGTSNSR